MEYKKHSNRKYRHWLSFPFIWMMLIPIIILDFFLEIYHHIAFPLYGIKIVDRSKYVKVDRQKLTRLSLIQKFNCMYCGYVNGFLAYAVEVAGQTEIYWCGIQHDKDENFVEPVHHCNFEKYNK